MNLIKKTKSFFAMLLCAALLVSVVPMGVLTAFAEALETVETAEFAGGSGTEEDPYLIETKEHLNNVSNYLDAHFKMIADIDLGKEAFSVNASETDPFTGTFDGDGHVIKNLYVDYNWRSSVSFAMFLYNNGTIKNLGAEDGAVSVYCASYSSSTTYYALAGGIVGYNNGIISNCYYNGSVSASSYSNVGYSGGIAAQNEGTIRDCYNNGKISSSQYSGGVAGYNNEGTIDGCYNTGAVSATLSDAYSGGIAGYNENGTIKDCYNNEEIITAGDCGGIAGYNNGTIKDCYNNGNITGSQYSGGIAGYIGEGTIKACYNNGNITGSQYAGGIAGFSIGTVELCYNTGEVSASVSSRGAYAGGIIGSNKGTVKICYNVGNVYGQVNSSYSCAGGIAGYNTGTAENCYNGGSVMSVTENGAADSGGIIGQNLRGTVTNCYNVGTVSAEAASSYSCGVVGYNNHGTVTNCYYADNALEGVGGNDTATKCSLDELKKQSTFVGFDFENIWTFDDTQANYNFPVLKDVKHAEKEKDPETEFSGGKGTETEPYLIGTKEQLNAVRNYPNAIFKLVSDIVFTESDFAEGGDFYNGGQGFEPIGAVDSAFEGTFDGDGHVIKNLYINIEASSDEAYAALFGYNIGTIKNLGAEDGNISANAAAASAYAGGIAGYNNGTIINCYNTCEISATTASSGSYAGGIAGYNEEKVINCYNTGSVSAFNTSVSYDSFAGGIVGSNYTGDMTDCYNTGNVSATTVFTASYTGGIAAYNYSGTITNCYNNGAVSSATSEESYTDSYLGGIAGFSYGTLTGCYNNGTVTLVSSSYYSQCYAGGVVGYISGGEVTNCYNNGNVSSVSSAQSSLSYSGGIAGCNCAGKISSCYNTGAVSSTASADYAASYAGGIAGYNHKKTSDYYDGRVYDCYNTGNVSATTLANTAYAGGIIAYNEDEIRRCYNVGEVTASHNTEDPFSHSYTGGIVAYDYRGSAEYCYYADNVSDSKGDAIKCTLEELKQQSTFRGFDFSNVWTMNGNAGYPYPELVGTIKRTIVSVSIEKAPSKLTYIQDYESFDTGWATLRLDYDNGDYEIIYFSDATVTRFDNTVIGKQNVIIEYSGFKIEFEIEILERSLDRIYIKTSPSKYEYIEGEEFDETGLVVIAYYNNQTNETITDYTLSGFDPAKIGQQTITVSYGGKSATFTVRVKETPPKYIEITRLPDKLVYLAGEYLDKTGMVVTAYYEDGTSKVVTNYSVDGIGWTLGTKTLTVYYENQTATFTVEVVDKVLSEINITQMPDKLIYIEGEEFDESGLVITACYSDNSSETVTDYSLGGFDSTPGTKTVTVTYGGKSATFTVEVIAKTLTEIVVTAKPDKLTYSEGESFDKTGLVVTAYYNNNTSETVTDYTLSGFDSTPGTKTVTVTYGGKSATFTVEVIIKVPSSVTSDKYSVDGGVISGIPERTTVLILLEGINEGEYCKVYNGETEMGDNDLVKTGMTLKIIDGDTVVASYTIVVTTVSETYRKGDVNMNGEIDAFDYALIKRAYLGTTTLSDEQFALADINGNGKLDVTEYGMVKRHYLGTYDLYA